ncbi:hypothetical protein GGF32_002530 [Allomyces javanicus]|nr:hypothetical protein GGF32_002530 [Allomyces javanicus]
MPSLLDLLAAVAGLSLPAPPSPPPPALVATTRDAHKPTVSPVRARTASVPSSSARPAGTRWPAVRSVLRRAIDAAVHPATAIIVSAAAAFRTDAPPTLLGAATFALVAACLVLVMDVPWRLYRAAAAKTNHPAASSSRAPSPADQRVVSGIAFHATVSVSGHDRVVRRALLATAVAAPVVASVLLAVLQARLQTWLLAEIDPLLVAVTGSVRTLAHVAAIAARQRRLRRRIAAAAAATAPPGDAAAHDQLLRAARQAVDAVHHAAAAVLAAAAGSLDDSPPAGDPAAAWSPRRRLRTRTAHRRGTTTTSGRGARRRPQ